MSGKKGLKEVFLYWEFAVDHRGVNDLLATAWNIMADSRVVDWETPISDGEAKTIYDRLGSDLMTLEFIFNTLTQFQNQLEEAYPNCTNQRLESEDIHRPRQAWVPGYPS